MPTTDSLAPTSVQSLFVGAADRDAVLATMARQLPADGLVAGRTRGRLDLAGATYRLLDSRVLETAARVLDQDVGRPLALWLARYQDLREAAARSLGDPSGEGEQLTLLDPHPLSSTQESQVVLHVRDEPVATITFRLELTVALAGITVTVRGAAIDDLRCAVLKASAAFLLDGHPKPLWKPDPVTAPEIRLVLRPPVDIPYVPTPRPAEGPLPQRSAGRPPVPPPGQGPATRRW